MFSCNATNNAIDIVMLDLVIGMAIIINWSDAGCILNMVIGHCAVARLKKSVAKTAKYTVCNIASIIL